MNWDLTTGRHAGLTGWQTYVKKEGKIMRDWIHKSEALKQAEVSAFDAKRYLSIFSQFIPSSSPIMQGSMVSPRVPELLINFKMLEENGLSMEQIKQAIAETIAKGKPVATSSVNGMESPVIQPGANGSALIELMKQLADNQANIQSIQSEILKMVQQVLGSIEEEVKMLHIRIEKLEKTMKDPE
ncbi:hypothetical protein M7775_14050 [Sporomusa sphaeroides DSM 2875]|jgi:hypothetical protein|uniref:hypothetical protein n=1 Tax=Sporomusa sphaeroides TaxID=47679 RepID=UPI002030C75E|nr:hypothetical protein [Sporomusa sphaeroides]MCM0759678.1 hypothetical protein [Sporomusa sphaeroides DSM 2875]